MSLTNQGQAFERSCLLLISLKLFTLSGILPFSINSFQLASFLALLIGLHLSFLIGAIAWFIKITKVAPFESVEVFRKDPFLALHFFLFLSMIFRLSAFFRQPLSLPGLGTRTWVPGSWDFLKEPELELEPSKFLAGPAPIQL